MYPEQYQAVEPHVRLLLPRNSLIGALPPSDPPCHFGSNILLSSHFDYANDRVSIRPLTRMLTYILSESGKDHCQDDNDRNRHDKPLADRHE